MSKDRAAPFSKKHLRTWLPVTGGMVLIGILNVAIGSWSYTEPPARNDKIQLVIPPSQFSRDAAVPVIDAGVDAGIDAGIDAPAPAAIPN